MTIPTNLIERALNLTGKNYKDFSFFYFTPDFLEVGFQSYLLSESFINSYIDATVQRGKTAVPDWYSLDFLKAIRQNESGNPEPLIDLLTKIPGTPTTTHH